MFESGISPTTKQALLRLAKLSSMSKFYLAGGTAVALHVGHRLSFDLDFFSEGRFDSRSLAKELRRLGEFEAETEEEDTLLGVFEKTKVSFFFLDERLIVTTSTYGGVRVAAKKDLMAMKVMAISHRGSKRDFIDLYALMATADLSLEEVLGLVKKKYGAKTINLTYIIRSLVYFEDADSDQTQLHLLKPVDWERVKGFFEHEVPQLIHSVRG